MGMCKVNGPDALPVKPAGIEKLGGATNNICEAGALYQGAHPSDFGQRVPTKTHTTEAGDPREVRYGQGSELNLDTLYYVRNCERLDAYTRTRDEERQRRAEVIARRKAKKARKKAQRLAS